MDAWGLFWIAFFSCQAIKYVFSTIYYERNAKIREQHMKTFINSLVTELKDVLKNVDEESIKEIIEKIKDELDD